MRASQMELAGPDRQALDLVAEQSSRCSGVAAGVSAMTVPMPGLTVTAFPCNAATTFWAVFGLIRSSWLSMRTEESSPRV